MILNLLVLLFLLFVASSVITTIHKSILENRIEYVDELIKRGADIDKVTRL